MATFTQDTRLLKLTTPLGPDVLLIRSFSCSERISGLYSIQVSCAATPENARQVKAEDLIGQPAVISVAAFEGARFFHGVVKRFAAVGKDNDFFYHSLEIVPWFWLLSQRTDCRIFQELTVPAIIEKILGDMGCPAFKLKLDKTYTVWDYCVQYRESAFQFISRMCEQEGIFFFFEHFEDRHELIFADSANAHEPCPVESVFRFEQAGTGEAGLENIVNHWEKAQELRPGKFAMRDHHFQIPKNELEVTEPSVVDIGGNRTLEIYDYPGEYAQLFVQPEQRLDKVKEEGTRAVRRRMQAEEAAYVVFTGASTVTTLQSGFKFELSRHYQREFNGKYVLTHVEHTCVQSPDYVNNRPLANPCKNSFRCIPLATPFVPMRKTPKPTVLGPQTAVVTGPKGEEIHTDKFGRVKVQFFWDRYGKGDETSSCWIRVSNTWAGQNWGAIHIPRIGQEVIVDFLEGDPDQPIITGCVYNADQMQPYPLPKQAMVSGVKTNSTKGGGGYNELAMDDTKGKELVRIHAEKDMSTTVEHDDSQTVHNNRSITVDGTHTETIVKDTKITVSKGDLTHTVATGAATYTVKKDIKETYLANQTTTVTNVITITAGDEIKIVTGESCIHMKKNGTIKISGIDIAVTAGEVTKMAVGSQNVTCNTKKVEIGGAAINSSAVGMHEITGALVKIN